MAKNTQFKKIPNPYTYNLRSGRSYYNKTVTETVKQEFEASPPRKIIFIQGSEGSGKSSTLEHIRNEPEILGEQYVPIYIHSAKVLPVKNEDILLNLYQQIKKTIDRIGIQVFNDTEQAITARVNIEDLHRLMAALETRIKPRVALLIFDDFDELFTSPQFEDQINRTMGFFRGFADRSEHLRIILSGRIDLEELVKERTVDSCLGNVMTIKMKIFDEKDFTESVTKPVEDRVTYAPTALEAIRGSTGGNLYCQQLLCYYIVLHLNTEKKNLCSARDVAEAEELCIADEREDFKYFWEKLSMDDKLVCSAIMDENVVKQRGDYYFVEQSSLLSKVFEPETLNKILQRLVSYDFLTPVDGRRFDDFPFKIPLYGYWIREVHPFIKTVVDHFDTIAQQRDFKALGSIVMDIPDELFPHDRQQTVHFIREWFQLKNKLKDAGRMNWDEGADSLKTFCKVLGLAIKPNDQPGMDYLTVDFIKLNIGSIEESIFILQDRQEPEKSDIQHLRDTILTHVNSTRPCLFFSLKMTERIDELLQKRFLNIIPIRSNDLKDIVFSSRPLQTLKDILLQRISSSQISPYQTDGPAITTFYGRQRELKKILGTLNRSFSIVGARKIGKSSLLARIKNELEDMGALSIFMDLESPSNPDHKSFLQRMELEMGRLFDTTLDFENDIDSFRRSVKTLPANNKKIIMILDEIDALLLYDKKRDYPLIKVFRSLFQEGYCQFVLSGFEVLQNVKRDIDSPFYNFCEEIRLGPLNPKHARDLIAEPMANIGIGYQSDREKELIMEYTARHPNLIQFFCKHLIEKLEENAEDISSRVISRTDIEDLYNFEYDNYILDDFYMFYMDLDDLEKLIVLLLLEVHPMEPVFSINQVNRKLRDCGVELTEGRIHKAILKLALRFMLEDKGKGNYAFALPHFPEILANRVAGEELKNGLIKRIKERKNGDGESV